jgi:hypothetical protein
MAFPGEIGWIGKSCPDHGAKLICTGMRSAAGWFLGTYCAECRKEDPSPHSRETHYYQSKDVLLEAAFADKVQWRDTKYRPGPMLLIDDQLHTAPVVSTYSGRYAVNCPEHGLTYLSDEEYLRQIREIDNLWVCPLCLRPAVWDDDVYDAGGFSTNGQHD